MSSSAVRQRCYRARKEREAEAAEKSKHLPIEIENAKGRCPKTPAQRLTGDAFRGTPPVSAISPKKSLRTALKMGRS